MATKNPSCTLISCSWQLCSRAASASQIGWVRKLKIGFQTVKQITTPTMNAASDHMIRVRSSARCSISGAEVSSISSRGVIPRSSAPDSGPGLGSGLGPLGGARPGQ